MTSNNSELIIAVLVHFCRLAYWMIIRPYATAKWFHTKTFIDFISPAFRGVLWLNKHQACANPTKTTSEFQSEPSPKRTQALSDVMTAERLWLQTKGIWTIFGSMEERGIFSAVFGALRAPINQTLAQTKPGLKESAWPTCFLGERCGCQSFLLSHWKARRTGLSYLRL